VRVLYQIVYSGRCANILFAINSAQAVTSYVTMTCRFNIVYKMLVFIRCFKLIVG